MANSASSDPLPDPAPIHVEGLYFGADPCWSPSRENNRVDIRFIHRETGESMLVEDVCVTCKDGLDSSIQLHRKYPCAACLKMARADAQLDFDRAVSVNPEPDDRAKLALAELRITYDECPYVCSITIGTDEESKENVVILGTSRKLTNAERDGVPDEIEGVKIQIKEPTRGKYR